MDTLAKLKDAILGFDYQDLWSHIVTYARKAGYVASKPLLTLYYVLKSNDMPTSDRWLVIASIAYVVLPTDFLKASKIGLFGWSDEALSIAVVIKKVAKYITPEVERQVEEQLGKWFPEQANNASF